MPTSKDIICLANSIKEHPCRCVAGVDIDTGEWIRPVSKRELGELTHSHFITAEGHEPTPLDIIRIYLMEPSPEDLQPENWKLVEHDWKLISETPAPEHFEILDSVLVSGPKLLGNNNRAVQPGSKVESSLALVKPDNPVIRRKSRIDKGDQPRLNFELANVTYDLPITDPIWKEKTFEVVNSNDRSRLDNHIDSDCIPLLTVSLGTEYREKHWKLVAAIIEAPKEYF